VGTIRTVIPSCRHAKASPVPNTSLCFGAVNLPKQQRSTRTVRDPQAAEIAREIVAWIGEE